MSVLFILSIMIGLAFIIVKQKNTIEFGIKEKKEMSLLANYLQEVSDLKLETTTMLIHPKNTCFDSITQIGESVLLYRFYEESCFSCIMTVLNLIIEYFSDISDKIIICGEGSDFKDIKQYLTQNRLHPIYFDVEGGGLPLPIDKLGHPYVCVLGKEYKKIRTINLWADYNDKQLIKIMEYSSNLIKK